MQGGVFSRLCLVQLGFYIATFQKAGLIHIWLFIQQVVRRAGDLFSWGFKWLEFYMAAFCMFVFFVCLCVCAFFCFVFTRLGFLFTARFCKVEFQHGWDLQSCLIKRMGLHAASF